MNILQIVITIFTDKSRNAYMDIRSSTDHNAVYHLYIPIKEAKLLIKAFKLQEETTTARGVTSSFYTPLKPF